MARRRCWGCCSFRCRSGPSRSWGASTATRGASLSRFQNYLAVLAVSLVSLMPNVGTISFGFTLLYMLGVWAAWVVIRVHQTLMNWRAEETRLGTLRRYIASVVGFGTLIYAGVFMARGHDEYRNLVPIGALVLLLSATIVSWELLISVAREREPPSPTGKAE